jgi:hypothetical protein
MRSSAGSGGKQEIVMWKHILMVVVSAILSALAELLRPTKPRK